MIDLSPDRDPAELIDALYAARRAERKDLRPQVEQLTQHSSPTVREEAAALRHQLNAAKLFAENPALQRIRELEAVEKIAASGELKIILGEKGLTERVTNLL